LREIGGGKFVKQLINKEIYILAQKVLLGLTPQDLDKSDKTKGATWTGFQ
jgi:hypothetical protein